jgi:hypothetical protein
LFRYVNVSNSIHKESILINIFWKSYQCSGSGKFWHGSGSVPEKTDIDTYKCLWIFDIKVIFLVVLKCKKIQKCILPCENFNFVTKISRYFAKFRNICDTKFRDSEISSTTLVWMCAVFRKKKNNIAYVIWVPGP